MKKTKTPQRRVKIGTMKIDERRAIHQAINDNNSFKQMQIVSIGQELIDNSIEAKSKVIEFFLVNIKGKITMSVIDDGTGISDFSKVETCMVESSGQKDEKTINKHGIGMKRVLSLYYKTTVSSRTKTSKEKRMVLTRTPVKDDIPIYGTETTYDTSDRLGKVGTTIYCEMPINVNNFTSNRLLNVKSQIETVFSMRYKSQISNGLVINIHIIENENKDEFVVQPFKPIDTKNCDIDFEFDTDEQDKFVIENLNPKRKKEKHEYSFKSKQGLKMWGRIQYVNKEYKEKQKANKQYVPTAKGFFLNGVMLSGTILDQIQNIGGRQDIAQTKMSGLPTYQSFEPSLSGEFHVEGNGLKQILSNNKESVQPITANDDEKVKEMVIFIRDVIRRIHNIFLSNIKESSAMGKSHAIQDFLKDISKTFKAFAPDMFNPNAKTDDGIEKDPANRKKCNIYLECDVCAKIQVINKEIYEDVSSKGITLNCNVKGCNGKMNPRKKTNPTTKYVVDMIWDDSEYKSGQMPVEYNAGTQTLILFTKHPALRSVYSYSKATNYDELLNQYCKHYSSLAFAKYCLEADPEKYENETIFDLAVAMEMKNKYSNTVKDRADAEIEKNFNISGKKKWCPGCNQYHLLTEFQSHKQSKDGKRCVCDSCRKTELAFS